MATKKKMLQAAAGQAGGAALDITDVFSTYLYEGTNQADTIVNNIDLSGEGGMTWIKERTGTSGNVIFDTERGATKRLISYATNAESTAAFDVTAFNSDGFSVGDSIQVNGPSRDYASWTFRKAPKFFDVVTYTGDGTSSQTINHNLGTTVGSIIVKRTDSTGEWNVFHRALTSAPETRALYLNQTSSYGTGPAWASTMPTSTSFTVGSTATTNISGATYVAYLFAHNDGDGEFGADGDADIIKCGSYTSNNSTDGPEIGLGFEPQFVIIKMASDTADWVVFDNMRGVTTGGNDAVLYPNKSDAEGTGNNFLEFTATGFKLTSTGDEVNTGTGNTYIYIAIRRGPLAQPESGTEVFGLNEYTGNNTAGRLITSSGTGLVDAAFINSSGSGSRMASRLTGIPYLTRNDTSAEINSNTRFENFDDMNGFFVGSNSQVNSSSFTYLAAMWTRAPGFFDAVAYTGDGTYPRNIAHNLSATPEMVIIKARNWSSGNWAVHHKDLGYSTVSYLDNVLGSANQPHFLTASDASTFTVGSATSFSNYSNSASYTYIAYLFATLPGISKVGSYTGNGTSQTINCGFTSGARYVLVKRTNTTGDWVEFNSEYGIVAGNEKAWRVNAGGDTGTSLDLIDPDSTGFIINQEASYNLNVNNSNYIFYAIA